MIEYPVFFTREDDGKYSVFAPDLPGCVSWGYSREEAREHIREAIEVWIESAKAEGELVPPPRSSLETVAVAS